MTGRALLLGLKAAMSKPGWSELASEGPGNWPPEFSSPERV